MGRGVMQPLRQWLAIQKVYGGRVRVQECGGRLQLLGFMGCLLPSLPSCPRSDVFVSLCIYIYIYREREREREIERETYTYIYMVLLSLALWSYPGAALDNEQHLTIECYPGAAGATKHQHIHAHACTQATKHQHIHTHAYMRECVRACGSASCIHSMRQCKLQTYVHLLAHTHTRTHARAHK